MRKLKHKEIEQVAQKHPKSIQILCAGAGDSGLLNLLQEHASMCHAILLWYVYKPNAFSKMRGNNGLQASLGLISYSH